MAARAQTEDTRSLRGSDLAADPVFTPTPLEAKPRPRIEYPADPAWKVREADLADITDWVIEALRDRHSRLSEPGIAGMLRGAVVDPAQLLLRTPHIVGLFRRDVTAFDMVAPQVVEIFVRTQPDVPVSADEFAALYRRARDWAIAIRASELLVGYDSDAPMNHVVSALSDLKLGVQVKKRVVHIAVLK